MDDSYDWTAFHEALRVCAPQLLVGIDDYELDDNGVREVIEKESVGTDAFWSDGLEDLLAQGASDGDLRAGVLSTLELWRELVLTALVDYAIELDWNRVAIDVESPLIDDLVEVVSPDRA